MSDLDAEKVASRKFEVALGSHDTISLFQRSAHCQMDLSAFEAFVLAAELLAAARAVGTNIGDAGEAFLQATASLRGLDQALADPHDAVGELAARVTALEKRLDDRDAADREAEARAERWQVISKSIMDTTPAKRWLAELDRARAEFERAAFGAFEASGAASV